MRSPMIFNKPIEEIIGTDADPENIRALLAAEREKQSAKVKAWYEKQEKETAEVNQIVANANVYMERIRREQRKPLEQSKEVPLTQWLCTPPPSDLLSNEELPE
jgi:hypothetical protein